MTNTSGIGQADAVIGTVIYLSGGVVNSFNVKNTPDPQLLTPVPEFGSVINFMPTITTIPPYASVQYTDIKATRLYISLAPGPDKTSALLALNQA